MKPLGTGTNSMNTGRSTEIINHDMDWILNQPTAKEKHVVVQHQSPTGSLSLTRTE